MKKSYLPVNVIALITLVTHPVIVASVTLIAVNGPQLQKGRAHAGFDHLFLTFCWRVHLMGIIVILTY